MALPVPRRAMANQDISRVRGEADGAALRLRHHDVKVHKRLNPQGELAGTVFEALEQIRVEALGASRMAGVAGNLASAHAARGRRPLTASILARPASPRRSSCTPASLLGFSLPGEQRELLDAWRSVLDSRTAQDWAALRQQLRSPGGLRDPGPRDAGASGAGRGSGRAAGRPGPRSERGRRGRAERQPGRCAGRGCQRRRAAAGLERGARGQR